LTIRTFYPIAFYTYAWLEVAHLAYIFCGSYWASDFLCDADRVFENFSGIHIQQLYSPMLDELMSIFYSSYFLFAPVVILPLFLRGRQAEVLASLAIVAFTYFANYILIYFFPALSPKLNPNATNLSPEFTGYLFASFTKFLQAEKVIPGGCFPSSHVSAAMAWALAAHRYHRTLGYVLIALVIAIGISTVYLRYHYIICPIFGLILGFVCYNLTIRILKKRKEDAEGINI
jgi:membrane-associated phospholipid phosphatase